MNILCALYLFATAVVLLALAVIGWRRRSSQACREFSLLAVVSACYVAGYALELTQGSLEQLRLVLRLEWCFVPYIPACWLLFTCVWCGYGHQAKRFLRIPLFLFSTLIMLLAQTNDRHGLVYTALSVDTTGPFPHLVVRLGPWLYVDVAYLALCVLVANALLVRQFLLAHPLYRKQALIMACSSTIPSLLVVAYLLDIQPYGVEIDPFGFSASALLLGWGVLRKHLLHLAPVARHGLVEMMQDPVLVFDDSGWLVDHNRAAGRFIPAMGESMGVTMAGISSGSPELAAAIELAKQQDRAAFHCDGQVFSLSLTTLRPAAGQILTICCCHDITGQARATVLAEERTRQLVAQTSALEAALEERHRAYEQQKKFLDMISHEYRTPLAIIDVNLLLLKQYNSGYPQTGPPMAKISRASDRLLHLFEASLKHFQIAEEAPQPVMAPVAPASLLTELYADAVREWPDRQFLLEQRIHVDTIIDVDPALLRIALWNLVVNAANYAFMGAPITISGREAPDGIYLEVGDHGPGIPPEERERIFDKYHRGSSSVGTSGSGLGLWLVRWIADEHGGSVMLRDNDPVGAVVAIHLPAPEY